MPNIEPDVYACLCGVGDMIIMAHFTPSEDEAQYQKERECPCESHMLVSLTWKLADDVAKRLNPNLKPLPSIYFTVYNAISAYSVKHHSVQATFSNPPSREYVDTYKPLDTSL